jgi:hypothetical protein
VSSDGRARAASAALAFLSGVLLFGLLQIHRPWLYDTDAGYHLAVGREIWLHGLPRALPWARFTLLAETFGDKELLFHYALAPFAGLLDPLDGGRLALALADGAVFAALAWVAHGALGRFAALLPLALALGSVDWDWRLVRLRPELAALVLLLAALRAVAARRDIALAAIGFLFALSYTAVHAFVGLCALWFVVEGALARDWRPRLLLYPAIGVAVGWLVHPNFPGNLAVFWIVAVHYFRLKGGLDVGSEIRPETTDVLLLANAALWVALLVLWRSRVAGAPAADADRRLARAAATAAVVFGGLFLSMSRFVLYALPFAALAFVAGVRSRGERFGGRIRLWNGRTAPLGLGLLLAVAVALPALFGHVKLFRERVAVGPGGERRLDLESFARALPPGATVAAPWGATDLYVLFAPQARYLSVLDPVFMALRDPAADRRQRELFAGRDPDVAATLAGALESRFLALPRAGADPTLLARLAGDPRLVLRHGGSHLLYEVVPDRTAGFVTDFRAEDGGPAPPRPSGEERRWLGFVDLGSAPCRRLSASPVLPAGEIELAPLGPGSLTLDGGSRSGVGPTAAVLGRGLRLPIAGTGERRVEVESCPDPEAGRNGFYLLSRPGAP